VYEFLLPVVSYLALCASLLCIIIILVIPYDQYNSNTQKAGT